MTFVPHRVTGMSIAVRIAAATKTPRVSKRKMTQPENVVANIPPTLLKVVDQPNTFPRLRWGVAPERSFCNTGYKLPAQKNSSILDNANTTKSLVYALTNSKIAAAASDGAMMTCGLQRSER